MVLMKKMVANIIAKCARNEAIKRTNSVCGIFFYQPKESEKLKNLENFNNCMGSILVEILWKKYQVKLQNG